MDRIRVPKTRSRAKTDISAQRGASNSVWTSQIPTSDRLLHRPMNPDGSPGPRKQRHLDLSPTAPGPPCHRLDLPPTVLGPQQHPVVIQQPLMDSSATHMLSTTFSVAPGAEHTAHKLAQQEQQRQQQMQHAQMHLDPQLQSQRLDPHGQKKIVCDYEDDFTTLPPGQDCHRVLTDRKSTLRGPKEEVDKCHKHLQGKVKEIAENKLQAQVPFSKDFHKHIIEKGGANIKKIREETDTKIDLPMEDAATHVITITGKKANVEKAKAKINKLQEELASVVSVEVNVPHKVHTSLAEDKELSTFRAVVKTKQEWLPFLIGGGGSNCNKIREQNPNVFIRFPSQGDQDQETIHLSGKKEDVVKAKTQIEAEVEELEAKITIEVLIPQRHHRALLEGGTKIGKIEQTCKVQIAFPPRHQERQSHLDRQSHLERRSNLERQSNLERPDLVRVTGRLGNCEKAKAMLLAEVPITVKMHVPFGYHGVFIGKNGIGVKRYTEDYNVSLHIPSPDLRSDQIEVIGTPSNVTAAVTAILHKVHELDEPAIHGNSKEMLLAEVPITVTINVPFDYHGVLIGENGIGVRRYMYDYKVSLRFPSPELRSDQIEVTGLPSNVMAAVSAIQYKVEELDVQAKQRKLKRVRITVQVPSAFHSKIIGPKGRNVNRLRDKYEVQISVPPEHEKSDEIVITGYEDKANQCKEEIESLVRGFTSQRS